METAVDPKQLEQEFFSRPFKFSYSGLNRLLYSPQLFYKHYVLQEQEEKLDTHLIEGKVIHCLLLNNGSFDEQFILSSIDLPGDNARMIINKICTDLRADSPHVGAGELSDYPEQILGILKEINLHQSLTDDKKADKDGIKKTGDQKRLEKILTEQNMSYFKFLKTKGKKDIIDTETLERCTKGVELLRNHGRVRELLGLDKTVGAMYGIYNELPIEQDGLPFGLKGILDNMTVDVKNKLVHINDLKTSGKTISEFAETVEFWNYWLQAAIYNRLAQYYLRDVLTPEWTIIFNFIVLDKYDQVYAFQVSDGTMKEWTDRMDQKLKHAEWHFTNRNFSLPYDYAQGQIML